MIRALLWKEYREHRAIWLTLAIVGGGGLYGLSRLLGPIWGLSYEGAHESLQSVAVLFAWTYGLVCGAMLLANENESGTMTFLDMLPARRIELWLVKCLFGLLLLLAQVAVLAGFVIGLGITETTGQLLATLLAMLVFGLFATAWSLLFSARGENVLNVIGLAFVGQIAGIFVASILLMALAFALWMVVGGNGDIPKLVCLCLGALGLTAGPVLGSVRLFTQLDRQRRHRSRLGAKPQATLPVWASWGRLLWLSYMQMRRLLIGLTIFALALGFLLPVVGPVAWPALTLFIGVLCGVTVWSDEQLSASFRFLGDQRFPLGRVWIVKIGMRFILAVFAAFLLLLPSLVLAVIHRAEAHPPGERVPFFGDLLHCSLVGPIVPVGTHLSMWLLYGFTVGQLCGLLFRKSLVAGVVALGTAGMLVCLWVPSLLGIGLHFWQVAGVPLCLLAAGWLLMPAWAADRLLARGMFVRLGSALLAAGLWTAGGLWYRVAEVPDVPEPFDMPAFVASIPPPMDPDKNPAGTTIRNAWGQVNRLSRELFVKREGEPLFPDLRARDPQHDTFSLEIDAALNYGWPNRRSELGKWLDDKFQEEWYKQLMGVADHPLGAVENLKQMTFDDPLHVGGNLTDLNRVLAARGLQQQTRDNHRAFVDNLRISLALSRNLQHRARPLVVHLGRQAELIGVAAALDHWLENLPGHPELLERVRDILLEHEAQLPDETDAVKASYLIAQNSLDMVPDKLVKVLLAETAHHEDAYHDDPGHRERRQAEINAAAMLWRVPWEHERHQRILRLAFQDVPLPGQQKPWQFKQAQKWGGLALIQLVQLRLPPRDKRGLALLHAAQLKVALRLYQAKNHGKLPATLDELVPHYLPAIPIDPFDGKAFRYRISRGEKLVWFDDDPPVEQPAQGGMGAPPGGPPGMPAGMAGGAMPAPPPRKAVPAGQAILWSVGENERDDGGTEQGLHRTGKGPGEDLIYLVPPPPR